MLASSTLPSPSLVSLQRMHTVSVRTLACDNHCGKMVVSTGTEQQHNSDRPGSARSNTDWQQKLFRSAPVDILFFYCAVFTVVKEDQVYQRYLTLYNRRIRFPQTEGRPVS